MRERPILFSGEMVRAILDGRKSQTRRVVQRVRNDNTISTGKRTCVHVLDASPHCPYGQPGDQLWVREKCIISPKFFDGVRSDSYTVFDCDGDGRVCQYLASTPDTDAARDYKLKVTPSVHMPRWASRLVLAITDVRVERVNEISHHDVAAEGTQVPVDPTSRRPLLRISGKHLPARYIDRPPAEWAGADWLRAHFASYWDSLNALRGYGWDANPWVWVIEFKRVEA